MWLQENALGTYMRFLRCLFYKKKKKWTFKSEIRLPILYSACVCLYAVRLFFSKAVSPLNHTTVSLKMGTFRGSNGWDINRTMVFLLLLIKQFHRYIGLVGENSNSIGVPYVCCVLCVPHRLRNHIQLMVFAWHSPLLNYRIWFGFKWIALQSPAEKLNIIISIITTSQQPPIQPTEVIRHVSLRTIASEFVRFFYFPISFFDHIYNSRDGFNTVHEWWLSSVSTAQHSKLSYTSFGGNCNTCGDSIQNMRIHAFDTPLNTPNHFHCKCNSKSITHAHTDTTDNEKRDKDNKICVCVCVCCTEIYECFTTHQKSHT